MSFRDNNEDDDDIYSDNGGNDSDSDSSSSSSSAQHDSTDNPFESELSQDIMPPKETIKMQTFQCIVTLMLAIICAAVVAATYMFLSREELDRFKYSFHQTANTAMNTLQYRAKNIAHEFESFSETITSYTLDTNKTWPYVTIPHFELRGNNLRSNTMTEMIGIAPIINISHKEEWENYTINNNPFDHYWEDMMHISPVITRFAPSLNSEQPAIIVRDIGPGPIFVPLWQVSPIPPEPTLINLNLLSNKQLEASIIQTINASDSDSSLPETLLSGRDSSQIGSLYYNNPISIQRHNNLHGITQQQEDDGGGNYLSSANDYPQSYIFHPIYDTFGEEDLQSRNIVAILIGTLQWDWFFSGLMPQGVTGFKGINGTYFVLQNSCGQSETYRIDGHDAKFLSSTDEHETEYNDMVVHVDLSIAFSGLIDSSDSSDGSTSTTTNNDTKQCHYSVNIYPSRALQNSYRSKRTFSFTTGMGIAFLITVFVFWSYVRYVQKRNNIILATAIHTSRIVSSLFPSNVRARIMEDAEKKAQKEEKERGGIIRQQTSRFAKSRNRQNSNNKNQKNQIRKYLSGASSPTSASSADNENNRISKAGSGIEVFNRKPIADLFPNCTVLFADIVGFTAWSSVREPTQVFQLLETLFHAFDEAAKKRRVFKVETVGDCYVAVTGLPDPRKDHAVVMAKFANECLTRVISMVKALETMLGPGTAELSMRFGMHSGAVTAGVLRGEKSRFQLFGDTVNTAARMESNGARERIHISQETADLLVAAGRSSWIHAREDKIVAKGKGEMQTFWLDFGGNPNTINEINNNNKEKVDAGGEEKKRNVVASSVHKITKPVRKISGPVLRTMAKPLRKSMRLVHGENKSGEFLEDFIDEIAAEDDDLFNDANVLDEVQRRLVDWVVELLFKLLKQAVAQRLLKYDNNVPEISSETLFNMEQGVTDDNNTLQEMKEEVKLATFDVKAVPYIQDAEDVELPDDVKSQLVDYVTTIATLYNDNEFHNFAHASHVTMAVMKLLSRITSQEDGQMYHGGGEGRIDEEKDEEYIAEEAHKRTYGISSDTVVQFALVFSALILDVDNDGVSNEQLVKEKAKLAKIYKNKSVLQQNSLDLAWSILMDSRYEALRGVIYTNEDEFIRFRQTVVHCVMATDMADEDSQRERNHRWDQAFVTPVVNDSQSLTNSRATLVIEYLMQASVVSHTMQHWAVYRKWTEKSFKEAHYAHLNGRSLYDPADYWFVQEIKLFDKCVVPVASRLKECGIFGVYGDEYLDYAIQNRSEWEYQGQDMVKEMIKSVINDNDNMRLSFISTGGMFM